ncbi:MAG: Cna B-type domain-containing protein, partial [Peptoniphilus harei]|nr:Cna B-type domain-containing protein [Peptoniphilus harei]
MEAPKENGKEDYAYNRPAYLTTIKSEGIDNPTTSFNISNPVKIKLEKQTRPTPLEPPKEDIKVEKVWQNKDGKEISAPVDKIEVELYRDGEKTDKKLELNKSNNWSGEFKDLDVQ